MTTPDAAERRARAVERVRVALAGEGGVPSGALAQFRRIGRWGTCVDCPRCEDGGYPETERCVNTARYDHHLRGDAPTETDVRDLLVDRDALADALRAAEARAVAAEHERDAAEMQRDDAAHSAEHWRESHGIERARADVATAQHNAIAIMYAAVGSALGVDHAGDIPEALHALLSARDEWPHATRALTARADAAVTAHAALAAAVREYLDADREWRRSRYMIAEHINAAAVERTERLSVERYARWAALDTLLRGAPAGVVGVGVVRGYLDAVAAVGPAESHADALRDDAWPDGDDDERAALAAADERAEAARDAVDAARAALDAALAAATTPKESP